MLSETQRAMLRNQFKLENNEDGNEKLKNVLKCSPKKLIPNLWNKTKYIVHYRNLQLYLKLGLVLKKIHNVVAFKQKPWLSCYIGKCIFYFIFYYKLC